MLTTQFYFFIFNDVNCTCTRLNETSAPFDIFYDWTDTTICCRQQSVGVHVIFLEFGEMRSISTFHVVIFSLLFKCIIEREVLKWCEKPTSFNIFVKTVFKRRNIGKIQKTFFSGEVIFGGQNPKNAKKNFKKFYCPKSFVRSHRSFIYL